MDAGGQRARNAANYLFVWDDPKEEEEFLRWKEENARFVEEDQRAIKAARRGEGAFEQGGRGCTMSAQAIIKRLPAELKEKIFKLVIDDNLKARKNMGWDSVNRAILTWKTLAERHDMGWELIHDQFRAMGWEEEEEEEEDDPIERMLEEYVNSVVHWAVDYAYDNGIPLYCPVCDQYSMLCSC